MNKSKTELVYNFRRSIVEDYLRVRSYRKTAGLYSVNPKTVVKWVKRYKENGLGGLNDLPRTPSHPRRKVTAQMERKILEWRDRTGFGAMRMRMELGFEFAARTIHKVLVRNNRVKPRRKKWRKKKDLRKLKARLKPFHLVQADIKYLDDMPEFYPDYVKHKLPRYEITIRDVRSGAVWLFYSYERTVYATILAADIFAHHLKRHGIKLSQVKIQTDNGSEFSGQRMHHTRGFRHHLKEVLKIKHGFIPPHYPNANADVESFHRLVEDEFYTRERFGARSEFLGKAFTYQLYFNLVRKNSYKNWQSPADILQKYNVDPGVLILHPVIIEADMVKSLDTNKKLTNLHIQSLYHHVGSYPDQF
ncbi:MAG: helix-turn-helix domain-containing protein [candidate division WOR-3 bacterium]|nr:helix-turn-helix domain-containing protein [candidate division WOR-3 bacterium]